eukprot:c34816_g1_i1 orf=85-828(-)
MQVRDVTYSDSGPESVLIHEGLGQGKVCNANRQSLMVGLHDIVRHQCRNVMQEIKLAQGNRGTKSLERDKGTVRGLIMGRAAEDGSSTSGYDRMGLMEALDIFNCKNCGSVSVLIYDRLVYGPDLQIKWRCLRCGFLALAQWFHRRVMHVSKLVQRSRSSGFSGRGEDVKARMNMKDIVDDGETKRNYVDMVMLWMSGRFRYRRGLTIIFDPASKKSGAYMLAISGKPGRFLFGTIFMIMIQSVGLE